MKQQNKWEDLFEQFMDLTEFSLIKHKDGWGLYDRQGANFGDIQSDRFSNAEQIFERMDVYIHDYIIEDIEDCLEEKGLLPEHEYDGWDDMLINAAPLLPENKFEFDLLDMIINHYDEIDLNNVYYEEEE